MIVTMGTFTRRRAVIAEAKANPFSDWFVLIQFTDGTWDYAQPCRPMPLQDRAEQIMYLRSRVTGNWYTKQANPPRVPSDWFGRYTGVIIMTTAECRECAAGRQQAVNCDIAWRCSEHGIGRLDVAAILEALAQVRAERDEAREDAAQLRALIKHYTTAPELEERLRGWDVLCKIGQQEGTRE